MRTVASVLRRVLVIVPFVLVAGSALYWGCISPDGLFEAKARNVEPFASPEAAAMAGSPRTGVAVIQVRDISSAKVVLLQAESPRALFAIVVRPKQDGWVPTASSYFPEYADYGAITAGAMSLLVDGKPIRMLMGEVQDPAVNRVEVGLGIDGPPLDAVRIVGDTWLAVVDHTRQALTVVSLDSEGKVLSMSQNQFRRMPWLNRREISRLAMVAVVTVVVVALALMVAFPPEPRLSGSFGMTAAPPPEEPTAYGSLEVDFASPLRRFVVLKDVEFSDASGTYSFTEAWVNTGKGGGAFSDETLLEKGGFQLVNIDGYHIPDGPLQILLKLRAMRTGSVSPKSYAGPNEITLTYSFLGRLITRRLSWDPNH